MIKKASGTINNATIKNVYALGTKAITSDEWIKITLKDQKGYVISYLNAQGSYTPVRTADRSKEPDVIYREDNGDDVIVYTKKLVELITYELKQPTTPTPTPGGTIPNIGNGSVIGGGGFLGGGGSTSSESKKAPFTDIIGHWAENAINNMYGKGVVSGVTATTFEPDRSITRAEFATLVVKTLKLAGNGDEQMFRDVENGAWYAEYVNLAAMSGLIVGYDGNFRPNDTITRQEAAVIAVKAYEFLGKEAKKAELNFIDKDSIGAWAKDYVAKAAASGIISGMPNGSFAPLDLTTRAQAVAILERIY
ncbi:MAG: S-layer homology domain-containing protein [Ruminococcaceae bacterium]|nr:S-layer homology domain-containing protein [Oscillospiraceae bacterium]